MPLSEESDPFARRHFAGSSGGETVPPWNGASGTRAGGSGAAGTSARRPRPRSAPGRTRPASISSRNEKARVNGLRRPPWLFFCPLPAPISTAAAPIGTGKDRAAHGDGLPDLPGLGGDGLPDHLPGLLLPAGHRRPDDPAALLPAPLPDLPTTPAASPPAPRRRPNARGVRFST